MERMPVCRICLVENVPMYIVADKNIYELYETLTDIPFVTEDRRPMLACYFCFAKLKQCSQLQRKCLEAEELFAQMMNEPNTSVNRGQLEFFSGLTKTPVEIISIVDVGQIESIAVKEEIPTACERLDDVIEPEEEHQSDDLGLEHVNNGCSDVEDTPAHYYSESDSEDGVPLTEFKMEVEEQEVVSEKRRASDTQHLELEHVNNGCSDVEDTPAHHYTKSDSEDDVPLTEFKMEVEEQEVVSEKGRASDTQRSPIVKKQKLHIRGRKLKDEIIEEQKKQTNTEVIQNTRNCTSKLIPEFKEPLICKMPRVNIRITNTTLDSCDVISQPRFNQKNKLARHIRIRTGKKPFQCEVCQRCFSDKSDLTSHICTHTREKPFKCDVCQCCFSRKMDLKSHIRLHTGEKPFKCDACQRCFRHKMSLTRHISTHTGEKPFKCDVCQRCFSQKVHLTGHIRIHSGEKPFKCDSCRRCFRHKIALTCHTRTHTGKKPFKCDACQRCFSQKIALIRHIRTHTGERPFKCDACQRSVRAKIDLTSHIRTHTGEKPFVCDICQLSFRQKVVLITHIRTHTGEQPFKCRTCQRSFTRKVSLNRHYRTHTGEKPFKCDVCQRCFSQKIALTRHISTHTGERPFKCDVCQRCFSRKAYLTVHIRTHTGEKPYICFVCQRSFSRKATLTRHIRTHHQPFNIPTAGAQTTSL